MIAHVITHEAVFCTLTLIWAALIGAILVSMIRDGRWVAAMIATLFASTLSMAAIMALKEHRSIVHILAHVDQQSYSFIFGDSIFLPFAAAMMALAWRSSPQLRHGWAVSWQWNFLSAGVRLAAGLWFRYGNDEPYYRAHNALGSFNAPSKLYHDLGAYPALFGSLFCVGIPLLLGAVKRYVKFLPYVAFALLGIGLWLAVGIYHDMGLFGATPLDPHNLHPNNWVWSKTW